MNRLSALFALKLSSRFPSLFAGGKRKLGEKGFTLIEIVVAMIILGLAYVAVLQNFSISMKNITRIEQSRTNILEETLKFDQLLASDEEEMEEDEYPVFLEGRFYHLVEITSEDGKFVTLKLQKL